MFGVLKRLLVGRPLRSARLSEMLLPKWLALPVFCSDPISSVAYATEQIVLALAADGLVALRLTPWVGVAVSWPSPPPGARWRRTRWRCRWCSSRCSRWPNLRGTKESGRVFASPTYGFVGLTVLMFVVAAVRVLGGGLAPAETAAAPVPPTAAMGGVFTLFLVLRAFASGRQPLGGLPDRCQRVRRRLAAVLPVPGRHGRHPGARREHRVLPYQLGVASQGGSAATGSKPPADLRARLRG